MMAKFTVLFKNQTVKTETFEKGIIHIGRDDINNIIIDSDEVAPAHTAVVLRKQGNIIKQLNDDFPLIVNTHKTKGCTIIDGDIITIGAYSIIFNEHHKTEQEPSIQTKQELDSSQNKIAPSVKMLEGNLQVMEGEHIGRIIPLKKAMTRLGHSEHGGVVVISRRKGGFYICALDGENTLAVNDQLVGDHTIPLNQNDTIVIDNVKMLFFI